MTRITKRHYIKPPNRDPSRATIEPSPPFRTGKIIIYVNSNLHKLYYFLSAFLSTFGYNYNTIMMALSFPLWYFSLFLEKVLLFLAK